MNKVQAFENDYLRKKIPAFKSGDNVRVHVRVVEGDRERIQVFQGVVIKRQGTGARETFTVRKISFGVGTERTFPVHSPMVAKIEIKSRGTVRRAKLYYLRERVGKKARIKETFVEGGIPASADIEHSDAERKRLGLDEELSAEAQKPEAAEELSAEAQKPEAAEEAAPVEKTPATEDVVEEPRAGEAVETPAAKEPTADKTPVPETTKPAE